MGLRMSAAWGCARAPHGAAQGRSMGLRLSLSMELRRGAAWGCAWALPRAAQGRSMGLRMSEAWGSAGAQHMSAAWGCA